MAKNVICFDLEGPLSPQDNAYEVMGLFDNGHKIFEVISKYDDALTLEGREDYEPGDTLSLIIPFLINHNISEKDIVEVSRKAKIVDGAGYLISRLTELGWSPHIISTSYQQHAYNIGGQVGVPENRIHCTRFPLNEFRKGLKKTETPMIKELETDILEELYPKIEDEDRIRERLDRFYYSDIKGTAIGDIMDKVRVVGGMRKVKAVERIAEEMRTKRSELIVVGDSITDYKMLEGVRSEGGIAIVFNGNKYAIPYANVGLATTDMRFLLVIVAGYMCGGTSYAMDVVREWEKNHKEFMKDPAAIREDLIPEDVRKLLIEKTREPVFFQPRFHYLQGSSKEKIDEVVRIHAESRALVRGNAARLG
ncbi:MAG: HAD hydrolase family protein [Candidatus Altiarchaeota archaeon]|nr:HAD hydrolase family protein [Candidatus Altiarchaeota archaeon]